jgi:outer membrane biosynthesis protein TonB
MCPDYLKEAPRAEIEGTVVLWTMVEVDGGAHNIRIGTSVGYLLD